MHGTGERKVQTVNSLFSITVLECVRERVKPTKVSPAVWHDDEDAEISSFVGMVHFHMDITTKSVKTSVTVAYLLNNLLFNCSRKHRRNSVDHCHTFVVFLPVSTAMREPRSKIDDVFECGSFSESDYIVPLSDEMLQTLQANGRDVKIAIRDETMRKSLHNMSVSVETAFKVVICGKVWKYNPARTFFGCVIPE